MNYESMSRSELIRILKSRDAREHEEGSAGEVSDNRAMTSVLSDESIHFLDDFPIFIWRTGIDAKCNYFNRAWLAFTGRPLANELGNGWIDNVHPSDVDECVSNYLEAFSERRSFDLEYRLRRHDGEYRWIHDSGHVIFGTDGLFSGYIGACVDITERKIAETTLASFISASPVGQVIFDADFRYICINEALASMNGFPVEDHYGRTFGEIVPDLFAVLEERLRWILKSGEFLLNVEISGETPLQPGVVRNWLTCNFPIFGSDGRPAYIGATVMEITDRKRAEEALLTYQERLKCLVEETFLAEERERRRIAEELHDQIGQTLALAKIRLTTLAEELEGRSASGTLKGIVTLIDNSIREIRTLTFQISPPLLFEVGLEAAVEWLGERLSNDHGLVVSVTRTYESVVLGEEQRVTLFRIVRELLVNVVKHAEARNALVDFDCDDRSIRITVEDDGRGFEPDTIPLKRDQKGRFGLFNIRQKVEYAGGEIRFESVSGAGSRITICFPLRGE